MSRLARAASNQLATHVRVSAADTRESVRVVSNRFAEVCAVGAGFSLRVEMAEDGEKSIRTPTIVALNQATNRVIIGTHVVTLAATAFETGNQHAQ